MSNLECFTKISTSVALTTLPEKFTFPFYYQPHPLAIAAATQLQQQLETLPLRPFDIPANDHRSGKMFGVLVVKNYQQQVGYLAAYSGQLDGNDLSIAFVPTVATSLAQDPAMAKESDIINNINGEIAALEASSELKVITRQLQKANEGFQQQLATQQSKMVASRKRRKQQRNEGLKQLSENAYQQLQQQLAGQSIAEKKQLQQLKQYWQAEIATLTARLSTLNSAIERLKKQRKTRSNKLQKKLFAQYQFLNAHGESKDLNTIFSDFALHTPPAGAGDCAAPKLLQYAFQHNLTPIAMAEFWWGAAPKSAIRHHKNYYPACYSKCQPILTHMLKGLAVDDNPLLTNPAQGKTLAIVYQDDDMLVVNKPAEFLSVPGKHITDSVYLRIKQQFPQATGPLIVHRLDMSTSGLLVIALHKRAHKALQKQFIERTVQKRYVALVKGKLVKDSGTIDLPMRMDFDDKPRQLVCYQEGKQALTEWQVIARENNSTRLHLFPKTGRTHQLRVHCAHKLGLNSPIVGDDHYGEKAQRLHLHAEYLALRHPVSDQALAFQVPADF
ncbi:tRNA pseudouridine32 synthase / 23S rRNA pseudouridine746 synthase [Colwellia chukchiensis]|uniref:tRNA pseudouridine32 synthase / 23S rRNA pseudouridine746 synthase n=1 Tax=Colwellia chukchiensis TaxID=641665 RepID=A0A1H7NCS7_9GAMM|nr:RluA family pseudouridine synthase [Colwellia chukchiensis]SEL21396.1 tRNA pseudouridine32 synthase / 23S rRNA pseudouridine746 synthase [Colwellia chukchiensis]